MSEAGKVLVALDAGDNPTADWLELNGQLAAAMLVREHDPETDKPVYLWLLTQTDNTGYDTFDSCVVAAHDETSARRVHPYFYDRDGAWWDRERFGSLSDWTHPDNVTAKQFGMTLTEAPGSVVCASYNAR